MPEDTGFHLKLKRLTSSPQGSHPGHASLALGSCRPLSANTRLSNIELFPGRMIYRRGAVSSRLNLFLEISEYFKSASRLACKIFSCSCWASSKGLTIFLGGKCLGGFFWTSSALIASFGVGKVSFLSFSFSFSSTDF